MPKRLRLNVDDCRVVLFIDKNCAIPYESWPKDLKLSGTIEKLKRRCYIARKYEPTRYGLTRSGYSLARWITDSIEHTTVKARN